jgi:hypothetical protein
VAVEMVEAGGFDVAGAARMPEARPSITIHV